MTHETRTESISPPFDPEANPGLMISYDEIDTVLEQSEIFNNTTSPEQGQYLLTEFFDFADAMRGVPGQLGVFATGHPFYALTKKGGVAAVPEISRFIGETREKFYADDDSTRFKGAWACAACQVQNKLPDLKSVCKPCDIVDTKPRDLFKALPDLDFWIVVDENSDQIEADVAERAQKAGFYQSDASIYRAVNDTKRVLQVVNNPELLGAGRKPDARLPIDLHVVTKTELQDCLAQLKATNTHDERLFIPIQPRSLHVSWERADSPYNFAQDFIFSMTEHGLSDELSAAVQDVRRDLAGRFTNGQLVNMVVYNDAKSARQLADPTMLAIFANRVKEWREL